MIIIIAVSMNTGFRKVKLALTVTLMFIMIMKMTNNFNVMLDESVRKEKLSILLESNIY